MKKRLPITFSTFFTFFLLLIILSVCVSCADNNDSSNKTDNDTDNQSNQLPGENQPVSDDIQETDPEFIPVDGIDYGGYTFRILDYDGSLQSIWYASKVCEVFVEEENGDPINDAIYKRNKEVEALYNITIGITPLPSDDPGGFSTAFKRSVLAGDDAFDTAFLSGSSLPGALNAANMAYDLLTLPSLDLSKSWWDQNSVKSLSIGGKLTAVIGDINLFSAFAPEAIYANKKLMQEYSLGNLYQLVRDGKWTWDVMYDIMKTISKDLNGDGVIDQEDQIGLETQSFRMFSALINSGEVLTPKNNDDIPELSPNTDRVSAVLNKVAPIWKDTAATLTSESIKGGFSNVFFEFVLPKFCRDEIMFHIDQLLFSFELRSMEADFAILPYPKYDEIQSDYYSTISNWWSRYTVIPTTCTDIDRTGNILDAMGYYSQKYVIPAYYDTSITHKLVRDEDSLDMLDLILKTRVYDLAAIYNWGDITSIFYGIANTGNADTFVSQFEKKENAINKAIQKTLDELE